MEMTVCDRSRVVAQFRIPFPKPCFRQPIQQQIIPYDGIKKRADQPIVWDDLTQKYVTD